MRSISLLLAIALLAACAPKEEQPTAEVAPPATQAAPYAAYEGSWSSTSMVDGTADPVAGTMMLTGDGVGSTMSLPDRPNIPITLSMSGDSLVVTTAEYESVLRKGVMVTTRVASVMDGAMLKGSLEATYQTPNGPLVVKGTSESKRAP
jgi:hypothetical protein